MDDRDTNPEEALQNMTTLLTEITEVKRRWESVWSEPNNKHQNWQNLFQQTTQLVDHPLLTVLSLGDGILKQKMIELFEQEKEIMLQLEETEYCVDNCLLSPKPSQLACQKCQSTRQIVLRQILLMPDHHITWEEQL